MEFEENNQTQDASFPEKPNETPAQDMPGAEAEESSRQPDAQARREKQYETFTMLHDLVYILAAITLVFVFLFRLVGVKGSSMYPTLFDHDYLVLESNFLYRTVRQGVGEDAPCRGWRCWWCAHRLSSLTRRRVWSTSTPRPPRCARTSNGPSVGLLARPFRWTGDPSRPSEASSSVA